MIKKTNIINVISNRNFESRKTKDILIKKLNKNGYQVSETFDKNAEISVCIGGDGAFLRSVHKNKFPTIPFIGINTGHLGFFQEISPDNIDDFIENYKKENYVKEEIFLVEAEIVTAKKSYYLTGVNEIVVKGMRSKVVHLSVEIDGNHLERFSGDAIIVSTPVGSTAYNFSSGGSIIYPTIKSLQITPLSPISSKVFRSLPNSVVVPGDLIITIKPEFRYENSTLLVNDGMEYKYDKIERINLKVSDRKIYKLNFSQDAYWDNLKSKFL